MAFVDHRRGDSPFDYARRIATHTIRRRRGKLVCTCYTHGWTPQRNGDCFHVQAFQGALAEFPNEPVVHMQAEAGRQPVGGPLPRNFDGYLVLQVHQGPHGIPAALALLRLLPCPDTRPRRRS